MKPNVIFMFVDDLGYGDVSCFNENSKVKTENIDKLASKGMRFTDSHASSALCTPSRYSLLTGRYNWRSKLKALVLPGDSYPLIEKDRTTLAHLFKSQGYHTSCVGKWHLGLSWQLKENPKPSDYGENEKTYEHIVERQDEEPFVTVFDGKGKPRVWGLDIDYEKPVTFGVNDYGFDYFYGLPASLDQSPYVYMENDKVLEPPCKMIGDIHIDRTTKDIQTVCQRGPISKSFDHEKVLDDMNDKVLEIIDKNEGEPFFIYYPTPAVHSPLLPNKKFKGKSGINAYCDILLQLDDMVGQISDKLEQKNLTDNTIFVFTSDNGCSAAADYDTLLAHGHNPSYIYRGMKYSAYEGGHRVPTIVSYPNMIEPNSVCDENICHTDFFKTFAEILGVEALDNQAEDSYSNLKLWQGKKENPRENTVYSSASGYFSICEDNFKLICCENGGAGFKLMNSARTHKKVDTYFELFDLSSDPAETTNIIDKHPEIVERLLKKLDLSYENGRQTEGVKQKNFEPDYPWIQINWKDRIGK